MADNKTVVQRLCCTTVLLYRELRGDSGNSSDKRWRYAEFFLALAESIGQDNSLSAALEIVAASGHAAEGVQLIDDAGVADELRPLREALDIYASGNVNKLKRLAPEVRTPTKAILEAWSMKEEQPNRRSRAGKRPNRRTTRS